VCANGAHSIEVEFRNVMPSNVDEIWYRIWIRFGRVVNEIYPRCGRDLAELWTRFGRDVDEIWPRCGRDLAELWTRFGRDVDEI
jgi:hypothetical protein